VLITNLTNYAQPLIRYEVPDRITISQDICRCGRPFASISRIDPRIATDTPTMALGELPTMVGHVGNPPLRLVKSPRRDA
jgi:hypothetical protein